MYNYSYHLLLAYFLLTHASSTRWATVRAGYLNNSNPRQALDKMEKLGKWDKELLGRLKRRQAAHENAFESLGIYAAAVVAGNTAGLSTQWMNGFTLTFFLLRCLYLWLYINITRDPLSLTRTVAWWLASICIVTTLWKAGTALNQ